MADAHEDDSDATGNNAVDGTTAPKLSQISQFTIAVESSTDTRLCFVYIPAGFRRRSPGASNSLTKTTRGNGNKIANLVQESQAPEITLHDDDPGALETMFRMVYCRNIEGIEKYGSSTQWLKGVTSFLAIHSVADKYQCPELIHEALYGFELYLNGYLEDVRDTKNYNPDDLCDMIEDVYAVTDGASDHPIPRALLGVMLLESFM
ncbi:hypothetical protein BU23DRAFT_571562 [Bimuria novae-zelandiae CBS 107.79]|uniref:BTB domain-containing protein n=1 Tax=Bimuria novae-zelandiae CBS 107.79 TaxID=1447943 RepID=A0A6A5UXD9_9PLEO|nr:hypothetical protein BU23DRAFT_571562 [Bimuria novae-zelandiae CBS 107.79]